MLLALLGILVAAVAAVMVMGLVLAVLATIVGLVFAAVALAFKMLPVVIVGYIAVKLLRNREPRRRGLTSADQAWLDNRC